MRLVVRRFLIFLFAMQFFCVNAAIAERPETMLDNVTKEMLAALKENDAQIKANPDRLISIIEKILVPHVDATDMGRWVVGRNAWMAASNAERQRFAKEFQNLLIRTYASSLTAYSNQSIEYLPIRGPINNKRRVQVYSLIKEPGRDPLNVAYRLVNKNSAWKVYDILIEGVSMLKGFRSQFASDIQRHGLDFVTNKMKVHNAKPLL